MNVNNPPVSHKIRPVCKELQRVAREELNEDEATVQKHINDLRYWILHQPHLKARANNDQFLLTFLRGSKHNLTRAKAKIDAFYTIRTACPEIFEDRDVKTERVREVLRLGVGIPLPNTRTKDGPRILLIRAGGYNASKYGFLETIKVGMMIQDIQYLEDDAMAIAGDLGIIDLANVTAAHFFQITPSMLRKVLLLKQDGSPLRQKGFHFINVPSGFEILANMGRKLLTEKNRNRIMAHSNIESLYEYIPKDLLPEEYGGEAGPIADIMDYWERKLWEYRDYLNEETSYGTDESKRVVRSDVAQSVYGLQGTFKQLEFD